MLQYLKSALKYLKSIALSQKCSNTILFKLCSRQCSIVSWTSSSKCIATKLLYLCYLLWIWDFICQIPYQRWCQGCCGTETGCKKRAQSSRWLVWYICRMYRIYLKMWDAKFILGTGWNLSSMWSCICLTIDNVFKNLVMNLINRFPKFQTMLCSSSMVADLAKNKSVSFRRAIALIIVVVVVVISLTSSFNVQFFPPPTPVWLFLYWFRFIKWESFSLSTKYS